MKIIDAFLDLLYPPKCIVCDEPIPSEGYCSKCVNKIVPISEECCFYCGMPLKACECNRFIYHFDGITSLHFNETYAQDAVYKFKFKGVFSCVNTFADGMAERCVKNFGLENIDFVTCVPASKEGMIKRGFNQSELLAKRIATDICKPFEPHLLTKKDGVKTQHSITNVSQRFENIRNGFLVNRKIKNQNVLIVDDIKTTGASLDECARQLKFAGATNIYCVTALISAPQHQNKET